MYITQPLWGKPHADTVVGGGSAKDADAEGQGDVVTEDRVLKVTYLNKE